MQPFGVSLEVMDIHCLHRRSRPPLVVPFRDSKLTRVLQSFFCGHGRSCMLVNINPCASTYDETLQALKFSAIATQVTTRQTLSSLLLWTPNNTLSLTHTCLCRGSWCMGRAVRPEWLIFCRCSARSIPTTPLSWRRRRRATRKETSPCLIPM